MALSDIAVKRPVFTTMMVVAIIVFGVIGYPRLGVDLTPRVDPNVVSIQTYFEGAAPEVMEETVTEIIEEQVATTQGVRELTSVSGTGSSLITVEFDLERDIDQAVQDVRDRIGIARKDLPREIDPPLVDKVDVQGFSVVLWIALSGDRSLQEMSDYIQKVLRPRFESLKGVGAVLMGGRRDRTVRIWVDRERLDAYGLSIRDVADAVREENVEIPGGRIESRSVQLGVKTLGKFSSISQLNSLVLDTRNGAVIHLRDVGFAEDGLDDGQSAARFRGEPAVGLGIIKQIGADTIAVARAVKQEIGRLQQELPPGMKLGVSFDSSLFIEEALEEIRFALLLGAILASVIVFLFLLSVRATLFIALAIPTSIVGTFGFLYLFGFTINTLTLLALTLAVGLVVDDAIVVLENIYRNRESGKGPHPAAVEGTREITFAVMVSTFTVVAVFLPVAFLQGEIGRFFLQFGVTASATILLSLFISLTLTPMLCSRYLKIGESHTGPLSKVPALFRSLQGVYRRLLKWSLGHRMAVIAAAIAVFFLSVGLPILEETPLIGRLVAFVDRFTLLHVMDSELIPPEDQNGLFIRFETPVGSSLATTDSVLREIEEKLAEYPEVKTFFGTVGLSGFGGQANTGVVFCTLTPKQTRSRSQQDLVSILRRELSRIPGALFFVQGRSISLLGRSGLPLEFYVQGPSLEELDRVSKEMMGGLRQVAGIVDLRSDLKLDLPEVQVRINRENASQIGVDAASLASVINMALGGQDISKYTAEGRAYDVRIRLLAEDRAKPEDILDLAVRNRQGELIKLANLVDLETALTPNVVNRADRFRSVKVSGNLEVTKRQSEAIEDVQRTAQDTLPPGYSLHFSGQAKRFFEFQDNLKFALILAVLLTYMILASQFESFVHPFTVMLALPLSVVGALGLLWVTGNTINLYSGIGLILLMGIVTKNSILLVDYTNTLRSRGMERNEALLTASPIRLRPILMTAMSTIFGVLPTALGLGPGSESRAPMAIAIIGGMATSTLLTLVVVPVVYSLLDDLALMTQHGKFGWGGGHKRIPVVKNPKGEGH